MYVKVLMNFYGKHGKCHCIIASKARVWHYEYRNWVMSWNVMKCQQSQWVHLIFERIYSDVKAEKNTFWKCCIWTECWCYVFYLCSACLFVFILSSFKTYTSAFTWGMWFWPVSSLHKIKARQWNNEWLIGMHASSFTHIVMDAQLMYCVYEKKRESNQMFSIQSLLCFVRIECGKKTAIFLDIYATTTAPAEKSTGKRDKNK